MDIVIFSIDRFLNEWLVEGDTVDDDIFIEFIDDILNCGVITVDKYMSRDCEGLLEGKCDISLHPTVNILFFEDIVDISTVIESFLLLQIIENIWLTEFNVTNNFITWEVSREESNQAFRYWPLLCRSIHVKCNLK